MRGFNPSESPNRVIRFVWIIAPALICAFSARPAPAASPSSSVFLVYLTCTELRDRLNAGATTIIVPIGGTEQSGPHMALGKHNARVRALAGRIAVSLGNALVAPVIAYVPEGSVEPASEHMRFPGTITIPDDVFEKTLQWAGRSFKKHGFLDIVFIGDHGGYQKTMRTAADRLNAEWARSPVRAHAVEEYYRATETSYVRALEQRGFRPAEIGTHAALADTSLTLALDPSLVRTDLLRGDARFGPTDGVYGGDPRRATADLGQLGVDAIIAETVAAIRRDVGRQPHPARSR